MFVLQVEELPEELVGVGTDVCAELLADYDLDAFLDDDGNVILHPFLPPLVEDVDPVSASRKEDDAEFSQTREGALQNIDFAAFVQDTASNRVFL